MYLFCARQINFLRYKCTIFSRESMDHYMIANQFSCNQSVTIQILDFKRVQIWFYCRYIIYILTDKYQYTGRWYISLCLTCFFYSLILFDTIDTNWLETVVCSLIDSLEICPFISFTRLPNMTGYYQIWETRARSPSAIRNFSRLVLR